MAHNQKRGEREEEVSILKCITRYKDEQARRAACSRYWMERALEDAKGEMGMADYEVRGWLGWHHHMTMVMLAMLFLLTLQLKWKDKAPMHTGCQRDSGGDIVKE